MTCSLPCTYAVFCGRLLRLSALLSQWAKQWHVTFNPSKAEAVLFTLRNCDHMPLLKFEKTHINFVESHKHLGQTLAFDGKWTDHITNVKNSPAHILGIM